MVDSLSFLSETLRSRVAVVLSMSCVYRFRYTAVSSMACSWLCFRWFALSSVELSSVCIRRWNIDGVTSSFSSRSVRLRWWLPAKVSQDWLVVWFPRGVLEVCEGFVMVVGAWAWMRSRLRSIDSLRRVHLRNWIQFQYCRWRWFRWIWSRSRLYLVVWFWFRCVPANFVVVFRPRR